jgi:photosystem II stability/assembly factor-like uncharacterized protein
MKKVVLIAVSALLLAGCGASNKEAEIQKTQVADGSILRSDDSGATFEPKVAINDQSSLAGVDILSWEFHPTNPSIIYAGTQKNGLYRTSDKGETWENLYFPPEKIYGLAIDRSNGDRIFASGVYEKVTKIYSSQNAGTDWKEVYTEPGAGSVITALAVNPHNPKHVLAATSTGVAVESLDSGATWKNVTTFSGPVTQIIFLDTAPGVVMALVQGKDILVSRDNGLTWPQKETGILPVIEPLKLGEGNSEEVAPVVPTKQNTLVPDQANPGVLYTGTNEGLYRSQDYGATWQEVTILESSKEFPIRAVAVNPKNNQEIVYTAGSALYRTLDGGRAWSTTKLDITRPVRILQFDPQNQNTLYLGLKKQ